MPQPLFDTLKHLATTRPASIHNPIDYQLAYDFLHSYRGSEATFNAYRREVERLLHWSWTVNHTSILALKRTDFEAFVEFCQSPPREWVGLKTLPRFKNHQGQRLPNPDWRPFVASVSKVAHHNGQTPSLKNYALSQKALQAIFSVLSSFYGYLIQEDKIEYNPVLQIRQKSKFIRKQQNKKVIRRLSELQWAYVIETAEALAAKNPEKHERTLFIMNALYGMYLRISELCASLRWTPTMGDFHKDGDGHWWFKTVGKGNKERDITVSDSMLAALKRYRIFLGLPSLPAPAEQTPLISKTKNMTPIKSTRHIRTIVQQCFDEAVLNMERDSLGDEADALKAATVHWLRHTGISDDVKHRPREHVRDDAGHGSSAITDGYIDVELRERHESGRSKKIKPS